MKPMPLRHSRRLFAIASLCAMTNAASAQQTKFGNINVVQNDAGNNASSVTLSLAAGSSGGVTIRGGNRGDYDVDMAAGSDVAAGVLISSVSQLSRDNTAQGDTLGLFYATSMVDISGTPAEYFIPVSDSPGGGEANINVSMAFFPYNQWIGGLLRNSSGTNGSATVPMNQLFGSTGLALGTNVNTVTTGTNNGQFKLNIAGFALGSYTAPALPSQNGVLLVCGARNEDNYALSSANTDGTFNLYVHDNGVNGASYEQDPVAFAYIPTTAVGTRNLVAMGRVNGDASTDIAGGSFSVAKGPTGVWYLTIPGQSNTTGTLIISPEGGSSTNSDNIVTSGWDAANNRWVIESRDLPTPATVLQNMATAGEDVFSFAFFQAPAPAYISGSFSGAAGDPVADADLGTAGSQAAITGTSAFPTIAGALTNVGSLAPLFLNGGTYNESLDLGTEFLITVTGTDSSQTVALNSLAGQAGSSLALQGGSSLTFGSDNSTTTMDGRISGGALSSLTKNGTGTLNIGANSPFSGNLTVNGGGILLDDLGLGGDLSPGLITINSGGVFTFGATGNTDFPDSTDVVINAGGRFELGQGENYGTITLDGGEFRFFSTSRVNVNNNAVAPTAGGMAYDARSGSVTTSFSGGGGGGILATAGVLGNFIKSTAGTVTMGNGSSFSPTMPVEIREGTLAFSGTHTVTGNAAFSIGTDTTAGTLRVDTGVATLARGLTTGLGGSAVDVQAPATLNLSGGISGSGPLSLSAAGILDFAPGSLQIQMVDVILTGNSPIGKSNLGTTELTAINPYSGQINVKDGLLVISGAVAGFVVVEDLGSLSGEGVIGGNLDLGQIVGGRLLVNGATSASLKVNGTVNLTGVSLVGLSRMPLSTGSVSIPVFGYGVLPGFSPSALQLESASLYRPGSGVFSDDAVNSRVLMSLETKSLVWTGGSGVWDLANTANWQATAPEFFYYGDAVTFNDSSSNAAVALAGELKPGPIIVDSNITNYSITGTFSDFISGAANLLKRGNSLLVMDAPNTYESGTVIEQGTLEIRQLDAAGLGAINLGSTGTGSSNTAFYLGGQRMDFRRAITISGGTGTATLGSRSSIIGSGDDNQFTSISLARDVIFDSNAEDRTDYESITGAGNITVIGTGRSIMPTTPALFTGDIRVSTTGAGSLQIGAFSDAGDRIPDASVVTVDAGATLQISAAAETIGTLNGAGKVAGFLPNGGTAILTIGTGNFSGLVDGLTGGNVLSLVKTGAQQLVLSGNNNYGGTTTVSGGTLQVGNGGATGDLGYGIVTVAEGATLNYNRTGALTQEGRLDSTGALGGANLVIGGDSTTNLILAGGSGTFSGAITVNQGTLSFGASNPVATGVSAPSITLAGGTTLTNGLTTTHAHLGTIQIAGGALITTSSGAASFNTENYQLNGNVTVSGGAGAAVITRDASRTNANSGIGLRGSRTFNVADVTGSAAADLVISTELEPSDSNTGADEGALVKQGAGTLQLAGGIVHSYTGATLVGAGTLVANGAILGSLSVSSGATLAPGASAGSFGAGATTLDGSYQCEVSGTVSDVLNVTGNLQLGAASTLNLVSLGGGFTEASYTIATWTGTLTGTFANVTGMPQDYTLVYDIAGQRIQLVGPGSTYSSWETTQGISGAGAGADSDGDGIANGIEFVLGGDPSGPNSDSNSLLPTATRNGGFLEFVFRRTDESSAFNPYVAYSSNLGSWTEAVHGVNGITVAVENDFHGVGIDRVTVRIPESLGTAKLFARMGIVIP